MQTNRDAGVYWQSVITTTSIAATNSARISDPEIDKLMDEQNKCTNDADREALFQKIWDRMNDLHPWVYLCQAAELNGAQKDLIGLEDLYDGKINLLTNLHYPEQERLKQALSAFSHTNAAPVQKPARLFPHSSSPLSFLFRSNNFRFLKKR